MSHRIIIKQVFQLSILPLRSSLRFNLSVEPRSKKQSEDILQVFESDFAEKTNEEVPISQEDIKFLTKLKEGIKRKPNGHYEMPLPFKKERPRLPNKACAEHRLKCLEK